MRPGVTGTLIDPDAPPERFAEAVIALADNAPFRRRMAESARAYALGQTWDAIMGALRERYQRVIGEGAASDVSPALVSS